MSTSEVLRLLAEGRRREKARTLYYRALAAEAESGNDAVLSERLNELHADEQHHLSRLTARMLELGGTPERLDDVTLDAVSGSDWELDARARENGEIAWYEEALRGDADETTRALLEEILDSERHHARELRGKWMSA